MSKHFEIEMNDAKQVNEAYNSAPGNVQHVTHNNMIQNENNKLRQDYNNMKDPEKEGGQLEVKSSEKHKKKMIIRFRSVPEKSKYVKLGLLLGFLLSLVIVGLGFAGFYKSATVIGGALVALGLFAGISFVFGFFAILWYNERVNIVIGNPDTEDPESVDQSKERLYLNLFLYLTMLILIIFVILGVGCIAFQTDILNQIKALAQNKNEWAKYFGNISYNVVVSNSKSIMYTVGAISILLSLFMAGLLYFAFRMLGSYRSWQTLIQFVCVVFFQLGFVFLFLAIYGWKYREVANVDKSIPYWVPTALLSIAVIAIVVAILGFVSAYLENKKLIITLGYLSSAYTIIMVIFAICGSIFISKSKTLLNKYCSSLFDYIDQDYLKNYIGCTQKYVFISNSLDRMKCPKDRIVTAWEVNLGKVVEQQAEAYGCIDSACCLYAYSSISQKINYLILVTFSLILFGVLLVVGSYYMFIKLKKKKERGVHDKNAFKFLLVFVLVCIIIISVFIGYIPNPPTPSPMSYVEVQEVPKNNTKVNIDTVLPVSQTQLIDIIKKEQKDVISNQVQINTTIVISNISSVNPPTSANTNITTNTTNNTPVVVPVVQTPVLQYTFSLSSSEGTFTGQKLSTTLTFQTDSSNGINSIKLSSTDSGLLSNYTQHITFNPTCPLVVNMVKVNIIATAVTKTSRVLSTSQIRILQMTSSDGVMNLDASSLKLGEVVTLVDKLVDFSIVKSNNYQIVRGKVLQVVNLSSVVPLNKAKITVTPVDFAACPTYANTSNSEGFFELGNFYPLNSGVGTQYNIKIESESLATFQNLVTIGGLGWSNLLELGDITLWNAAMLQNTTISSKILNSLNNEALEGVTVYLHSGSRDYNYLTSDEIATKNSLVAKFTSNADGIFSFPDLKSDKYTLLFKKEGFYTEFKNFDVIGKFTGQLDTIIMTPSLLEGQIRFVLSWPNSPKDLDLHSLFKVSRFTKCEVYFGKRVCGGVGIDTDNFNYGTNGVETITINTMGSYIYAIAVHKYIDISTGQAEGDDPINTYNEDSSDSNVISNTPPPIKVLDLSLIKSEAKLSVYVPDFKGPVINLSVPSKIVSSQTATNENEVNWWLAFCLNGKLGVNSLSVVNVLSVNKPDVTDCEKIYK